MDCRISREQLWSWIDREAPELEAHLEDCPTCRRRSVEIRDKISAVAAGASRVVPLPERIGAYRIRRLLGEGGQAWIYEAEQESPRRTVALKVLKGAGFANRKLQKHFHRESQALAQLRHPAIATIHEAGVTDDGLYFFAMERVEGRSLDQYVEEESLDRRRIIALFQTICEAVGHAHGRGVIHRDLKPSNILVDATGTPRILDFGLARLVDEEAAPDLTLTRTGVVEGTPRYMSPEQAAGLTSEVDFRADVYSLGVILYELLTKRCPYDSGTATRGSSTFDRERIQSPDRHLPELRGEVSSILMRALAHEPRRRYVSVAALTEDLRRFLCDEPILARPPSRRYRLRKHLHRQRTRYGLGALLVIIGLMGFMMVDREPDNADGIGFSALAMRRDLFIEGHTETLEHRIMLLARRYRDAPEVALLLAQMYDSMRARHQAVGVLEEALAKDPGRRACRVLRDELRGVQSDPDDFVVTTAHEGYLLSFATLDVGLARQRAVAAARLDSTWVPALVAATYMCDALGDGEGALSWLTRLVEIERDGCRWRKYRVDRLYRLGRFEEALVECNGGLKECWGERDLFYTRARVHRRLKQYAEAVGDLKLTILANGPGNPDSVWPYFHRGTQLWLLGRDEEAAADYYRHFELLLRPSYGNARLYLILRGLGRADEAQRLLDTSLATIRNDPWLELIFDCLAGRLSPAGLVAAAENPAQSCEANYYAAEVLLLSDDEVAARHHFVECLRSGQENDPVYDREPMSEYELAGWRLETMGGPAAGTP